MANKESQPIKTNPQPKPSPQRPTPSQGQPVSKGGDKNK